MDFMGIIVIDHDISSVLSPWIDAIMGIQPQKVSVRIWVLCSGLNPQESLSEWLSAYDKSILTDNKGL